MKFKKIYLILSLIINQCFAKIPAGKQYLIESIKVSEKTIDITPHRFFARKYLKKKHFFAHYENGVNLKELDQATVTAPFIMSVISIIWASGETYYVPVMDEELAKSLKVIKEVYKVFFPKNKWEGRLIAERISGHEQDNEDEEDLVALTFSGGLDSVYTSLAFEGKKQMLITALGFSEEAERCWEDVKDQVSEFALTFGSRQNYFIRSNFRSNLEGSRLKKRFRFHGRWREYFQESLSLAGIALPLLAANKCKNFYIPSSYNWSYNHPWGSHPFIDDNIRFKDISVKNHTYDVTRFGKIQHIVNMVRNGYPKPQLHTCRHGQDNTPCTTCMKGLQTANGLIVEGQNPLDYGYPTNVEETMEKCSIKLAQKYPYPDFDSAEAAEWLPIKKRIEEILAANEIDEPLASYIYWLLHFNFDRLVSNSQIYRFPLNFSKYRYFLSSDWRDEFLKDANLRII